MLQEGLKPLSERTWSFLKGQVSVGGKVHCGPTIDSDRTILFFSVKAITDKSYDENVQYHSWSLASIIAEKMEDSQAQAAWKRAVKTFGDMYKDEPFFRAQITSRAQEMIEGSEDDCLSILKSILDEP